MQHRIEPRASGRIPSLDGIRGVAILMVLCGHVIHSIDGYAAGRPLVAVFEWLIISSLGVSVFFVLSGYLITQLLLGEAQRTGRISVPKFYVRRFFRIFPAYYLYLTAIAVAGALGVIDLTRATLAPAYLYVWNYTPTAGGWWLEHTWSLSMEEQFYLLWPATLVLCGIARARWVALGIIGLSPFLRVATYFAFPVLRGHIGGMLHTRADALMFGCALALFEGSPVFGQRLRALFSAKAHVLAPLVLAANMLLEHRFRGGYTLTVGYTIEGITITLMIAWLVRNPASAVGRVFNWRPLAHVGAISYSLYLWQQPFLRPVEPGTTSAFPLNLGLALVAAELSYHVVERPFLKLRDRVVAARSAAAATAVAAPPS